MRTKLWLSLAVTLAVGCKTDPPASSNGSASDHDAPSSKGRSAKIDVKPVAPPSLPADDSKPDKPDDDDRRARRQARLDTDGDGKVSDEERAAAMKQRMTRMHDRLDSNGDGKLTFSDTRLVAKAVEVVEREHPDLVGGMGLYNKGGASYVHIDARGRRVRWRG